MVCWAYFGFSKQYHMPIKPFSVASNKVVFNVLHHKLFTRYFRSHQSLSSPDVLFVVHATLSQNNKHSVPRIVKAHAPLHAITTL